MGLIYSNHKKVKQQCTCSICHQIFKNPIILSCPCMKSICREHMMSSDQLQCSKCLTKVKIIFKENHLIGHKIKKKHYLNRKEKQLQKRINKLLDEINLLQIDLKKRVDICRTHQFEHFSQIRRQIESLARDDESWTGTSIEEMLEQVDMTEKGFEKNFNQITLSHYEINIENEREILEKTFRDLTRLNPISLQLILNKYEFDKRRIETRFENFKFFDFDLKQNKLVMMQPDMVKLRLNGEFLNETSVRSHQVVTCLLRQKTLKIFNLITNLPIREIENQTGIILCLISFNKTMLITGDQNSYVKVWDLNTGECLQTMRHHLAPVVDLKLLDNNKFLVSCSQDSLISVWDMRRFKCLFSFYSRDASCLEHISGTRNIIISGNSWNGDINVWNLSKRECAKTFEAHKSRVSCLKTLPNNGLFVSGSFDGSIKIWDSFTFECVQKFFGHTKMVTCLEFKEDTTQLISSSWDKSIIVWTLSNNETEQCMRVISNAHTSFITCLKLAFNGLLLSSSWDKHVKLWDLDSYECVETFQSNYPINKIECFV